MAASTHPCADWRAQATTPRERYRNFAATYQESVRRFLAGGMHVHAGFGNADSRVRVMTALRRYLPVLHALSPSSPFKAGRETGFKSYRLNLMSALPRTNLPPAPHSRADFDLLGEDYKFLDFVEDGSELWRDIPAIVPLPHRGVAHLRHLPPLEDALSVVALYAALVRKLAHLDADGALPPEPPAELIAKNRGLASRHGVLAFLGDVDAGGRVIDDYLARLVGDLDTDARALGCEHEMRRIQAIIREGTGADRQIDHFRLRRLEGDRDDEALRSVVDLAVAETREGIEPWAIRRRD